MDDHDLAEICRTCAHDQSGVTVYHLDESLVVCLRGSLTFRDWTQDFLVLETSHPLLGRVHEGFLAEAASMAPQIAQVCAGRQFSLTGHSRGGAIALLLGGLLKGSGQVADAIVTFGAPRAGGAALAEALKPIPVRQYRCGGDPIPFWPEPPFADAAPLINIGIPALNPISDHAIGRYASVI